MKKCTKCGEKKPATKEFFKRQRDKNGEHKWFSGACKACQSKATTLYCKINKTHKKPSVRAYQKRYREANKTGIRNSFYKRKYGITWKDVKTMAKNQNDKCAICKSSIDFEDRRSFCVDHCHDSGVIRGILCNKCNRGIGFLNHDIQLLLRAANYVSPNN